MTEERQKQLENQSNNYCPYTEEDIEDGRVTADACEAYRSGFCMGGKWSDEHPSDETISDFVCLYEQWEHRRNKDAELTPQEFIKKYWEI